MAESLPDSRLSWRSMLAAVPRHNEATDVTCNGDGTVHIRVRTSRPPWLTIPPLSWIVPVRKWVDVRLDTLGSEVWRKCNGTLSVEQIVEEFAETHRLTFHEARVAVTEYIRDLIQRGALAIVLPIEAEPTQES